MDFNFEEKCQEQIFFDYITAQLNLSIPHCHVPRFDNKMEWILFKGSLVEFNEPRADMI